MAHRIDVHFHPTPPGSLAGRGDISANARRGWSMEKSLADMEQGGVAKSMLSLPHPASTWSKGIEAGRSTARQWNEYLAGIVLVERFEHAYRYSPIDLKAMVPKGGLFELKKLYYDTAQAAHRHAMSSLRELVPATQILFGTDYPYRTPEETAKGLRSCGFSEAELRSIDCDNALQLLPARN